jgi:hypothetical protein
MRGLCSRLLVGIAFGLPPICLGGLSGCDSKPADGSLVEQPRIEADQIAEVKAQYRKRILATRSKPSKKVKAARSKSANSARKPILPAEESQRRRGS